MQVVLYIKITYLLDYYSYSCIFIVIDFLITTPLLYPHPIIQHLKHSTSCAIRIPKLHKRSCYSMNGECPWKWFSTQSEIRTPHTTYISLVYQLVYDILINAYEPALGNNKTIPTILQVELYIFINFRLYSRSLTLSLASWVLSQFWKCNSHQQCGHRGLKVKIYNISNIQLLCNQDSIKTLSDFIPNILENGLYYIQRTSLTIVISSRGYRIWTCDSEGISFVL